MRKALCGHWPEYLIEAAGLGFFMMSACVFAVVLFHPASPAAHRGGALVHRAFMGLAMASTAVSLIYSPWGKRSGAHFNPAVTMTFLRLGRVRGWDALFYVTAQCLGGVAGVLLAAAALGPRVAHPAINYVVTMPGRAGVASAFVAELVIAFVLMSVVLGVSNTPARARFTGLCAGALVAIYITLEAPLSGTSMNPARTLASAVAAESWRAVWIYFIAPLAGMLAAAEVHVRWTRRPVRCAKLQHDTGRRCIFRCGYAEGS